MGRWESLLGTIQRISVVDDIDEFGPVALSEIDLLIGCDFASFNEVDPFAGRAAVIGHPRPPTAPELRAWQRWSHQNPSVMHMLRTGDGSARRISDFMTSEQLHRLELYEYVYQPLGAEYQVAVGLPAPRPLVLGIALNRHSHDFSDEEVQLLDRLRPHLAQAHRAAQLLSRYRQALGSVAGALRDEGRAFHVLGTPLDGPAGQLLSGHFAADGMRPGALPPAVTAWLEREKEGMASDGPTWLRRPLVLQRDDRRLTLKFVPGGRGPDLLWMDDRPAEAGAGPLQRLGLSAREAEVLWLLARGSSVKGMARDLGISTGTVKKHLERVYRKLGVSTATAAVAQAFDALSAGPPG